MDKKQTKKEIPMREQKTKELPIRIDRVVELTGYSRSYIYKLMHWKKIPYYRPNNGRAFFYENEIINFLHRGRQYTDYELSEQAEAILNRQT